MHSSYTLWLGALARVDLLSGTDKFFTLHGSYHLTLHRTPTEKAEDVYRRQAGQLLRPSYNLNPESISFKKHLLDLFLEEGREASKDIAISGLGWLNI